MQKYDSALIISVAPFEPGVNAFVQSLGPD